MARLSRIAPSVASALRVINVRRNRKIPELTHTHDPNAWDREPEFYGATLGASCEVSFERGV
jgi:hypothetical protein